MMYYRLLLTAGTCLSLISWGMGETPGPPTVSEVRIVNIGSGTLDESFVKAHISSAVDKPFDRVSVSRDIRKLLDTERFSEVKAEIEPVENDVRLIYSFRNRLKLSEPVIVLGSKQFRSAKIQDFLELRTGDLVDKQVLAVKGQKVTDKYHEDYFPDVSLDWDIIETDTEKGTAKVRLHINEGRKTKFRGMLFNGNAELTDNVLKKTMKQRARWDPRWFFRKKQYSDSELEEARVLLESCYLDRGYLDVRIDFPTVINEKKSGLLLSFVIHEGIKYNVGDVFVSGMEIFDEADLLKTVSLKKGDIASGSAIENAQQAARDFYGSRGYLNTNIRRVLEPDASEKKVNIRFLVAEGQLTKIRNIIIRGNSRTKDKVIRRELLVDPGDEFNEVKVRRTKAIITNLGFFSNVRYRPVDTQLPDQKDLMFEVEEKPTGNLMFGAGFSSIDKMMGFMEISQGNFDIMGWPHPTGAGQKLKLRAQLGSRRKIYELSFVEPWFLDKKLSLGTDLYHTEVSSSDYRIDRTGTAITLAKKLPGPNRIALRYELQKISSITDTNTYYFLESDEMVDFIEDSRIQSSLRISLMHNSCNHPFVPTRGARASIFAEASGGVMGFDTSVYKLGAKAVQYVPLWFGHVLSLRGEYEAVDTYGDTEEVPYSERLFAGGGRTIRGFDYRDVGPKVLPEPNASEGSYRAYGGQTMVLGSADYTIPIVSGLRLAFFYDIGNVWRDVYEFSGHNLASSAGTGLRLDVPGFPIRLDRAWVIQKDHDITNEDEWSIWIGHDF